MRGTRLRAAIRRHHMETRHWQWTNVRAIRTTTVYTGHLRPKRGQNPRRTAAMENVERTRQFQL